MLPHSKEAMSMPNKKQRSEWEEEVNSRYESRIHKEWDAEINSNKNISENPQQNRLCRKNNVTTGRRNRGSGLFIKGQ